MSRINSDEAVTRPGYCEYLTDGFVGRKLWILRIAVVVLCIAATLGFSSFLVFVPQIAFIWLLLVAVIVVMTFRYTTREFEYCISTGEMSIDTVYGKKIRKNTVSFKFSSVDSIFPVESIKDEKIMGLGAGKVIYACPKKSDFLYCIYVKYDGSDLAVVVDSCTKLVDCFKFYKRAAFTERK
ncbi:MAG: ABC transporter ATP-binding protein [Ruminococcaceae bacterium]|nr:ABC transporter ATP-binding protein [Oscillospiraceae bacterium]